MIQFGGHVNPVKYCCTTRKRPCATNVDSDLRPQRATIHIPRLTREQKASAADPARVMKIGLFGAFAFLLGCAGLYYLTQFSLVTSLSDTRRSGRSQREKTWLQEHQLPAAPADVQKCVRHNWHQRQRLLKQSVFACVGADMDLSLRERVFALAKSLDFCTLINELTAGVQYLLSLSLHHMLF